MLFTLPAFTAGFLAIHIAATRIAPENPRAFAISRAAAAALLTVLGMFALVDALPMWETAFLYRHEPDDWMRLGLTAIFAHMLSDFVWIAWSRWRFGIVPRKDLVIHHGLGLIVYGTALAIEIGYAFALITMITEVMPVTSGYGAIGKVVGRPEMVESSARWRLRVLIFLRFPVWLALFALICRVLILGLVPDGLMPAFIIAFCALIAVMGLDRYWVGKSRAALARVS